MTVSGDKIRMLIEIYGDKKGYPQKSHIKLFCEDNSLNYVQWSSYCSGSQKAGLKIVQELVNIFQNLNLNWLLKDEPNIFVYQNAGNIVEEPVSEYEKEVSNQELMAKLLKIEKDVDKIASKFK